MKILPLFAAAAFGLALSGCSNQYFERKDKVTFSAGDAVASNIAIQTPDPWPSGSQNTTIPAVGEKTERLYRRYVDGSKQSDSAPQNVNNNTIVSPGAPGGGGNAGGAPGSP